MLIDDSYDIESLNILDISVILQCFNFFIYNYNNVRVER